MYYFRVWKDFSLFQDENIKACLPFEYTADDYAKKDIE
jgi:hypothetical protein